jgi:hypothetical protein
LGVSAVLHRIVILSHVALWFTRLISRSDSYYSRIIAFIGCTDGNIIQPSTNISISPITSGSVSPVKLSFWTNRYMCFAVPTPWAAYAFHPLDGYSQSIPYHSFVYLFPMHRFVYLSLFIVVNLWTILVCHFFSLSFSLQSIQLLPDPRFRHDHWSLAGKHNQRSCSPHFAPSLFHC